MRVTLDLEKDIIIIPDNFSEKIAQDNERLVKYGAKPVKGIDRIKHSFKAAMADTITACLLSLMRRIPAQLKRKWKRRKSLLPKLNNGYKGIPCRNH